MSLPAVPSRTRPWSEKVATFVDRFGSWVRRWGVPACLLLIAAFHLGTMHRGHNWNGDYALYLMHARNLVEGAPYEQTPYVMNDISGNPSPQAYPPGFPLLLAPIYALFGDDLVPMKVTLVLLFVAALFLASRLVRTQAGPYYGIAVITILGFNPAITTFLANNVVSDIPFLFVVCLFLAIHQSLGEDWSRSTILKSVLAGGVLYFCVLVRPLGLALLLSLVLYDLLRKRTVTAPTLVISGVFAVAFGVQFVLSIGGTEGPPSPSTMYYSELVHDSILEKITGLGEAVVFSVRTYAYKLNHTFWEAGTSIEWIRLVTKELGWITIFLIVGGWAYHAWTQLSLFDVFTAVYLAALLPWDFHWDRYLLPALPFCVFYAFFAGVHLVRRRRWLPWLLAGFLIPLALVYGKQLVGLRYAPPPNNPVESEAQAMYQYLRTATPPEALIVFGKPRFTALYTGRRSMRWYGGGSDQEYLQFFSEAGVDYAVNGPANANPFEEGRKPLITLLTENHPQYFVPVYRSPHYAVYQFRPPPTVNAGAVGNEEQRTESP